MSNESRAKSFNFGLEFAHGTRRVITSALILIYFISLGFNLIQVTTLFAISNLILLLFEFPTGAFADYFSRKRSLQVSFFLMAVSFFGIFLFRNFWFLSFAYILSDIAWAFNSGASSAWIIDCLNYSKKKYELIQLISKSYIFERTGRIVGGLIGLIIVAINFRFIWLILSLFYLIIFIISFKLIEERNFKPVRSNHSNFIKPWIMAKKSWEYIIHKKNINLRILLIEGFFNTLAVSSFFTIVPLFLLERFGVSPANISGLYSLLAILILIGPVVAERTSKRMGFKNPLAISFIFMGIFVCLFAFSNLFLLAIIYLAIFEIILSGNDVLHDSACHYEFSSKIRASLGSLSSVIWSVASSISVFLTGLGITYIGFSWTLSIAGIFLFLASLIVSVWMREIKK